MHRCAGGTGGALPHRHDLTSVARDVAYTAIGLGVLGFQRAQVGRRELERRLVQLSRHLDERAAPRLDELERVLPDQLAAAFRQVRQKVVRKPA
jgi:hypothetical protein